MSPRVPHAAFCEEFDEDANVILPETRRVANVAAKRSKTELRPAEGGTDGASDSGYSSRTAATVNSAQSGPSGRRSPPPLKVNTTLRSIDLEKIREIRSSRKEKGKERQERPAMPGKMPVETLRSSTRVAPHQRSPSKPKRRDSVSVRHHHTGCWECEQGIYHPSTPIDPRPLDYGYYVSQAPSVHDFPPPPPSPQSARYPPPYAPEIQIAQRGRRGSRSTSYHLNSRPLSYHGSMTPDTTMMYAGSMTQYEHGPPPSASAYTNTPTFPQPPYHQQQLQYYSRPESIPPSPYERQHDPFDSHVRESTKSRRRSSIYGPPVVNYAPSTPDYDDGEPLERKSSRDQRSSRYSQTFDRDEDYYLMPPPPLKQQKPPPQVIQKRPDVPRKAAATGSTGARRGSQTWDMSELEDSLPDRPVRKPMRATIVPERSQSVRDARRSTSYQDSARPSRIAIEDSRRRHTSVYDYDGPDRTQDLEEKQRDAEEYQAARTGKPVPLTADALFKAKNAAHRPGSDSGSQKSRSNSSRGSDARTRDGSGIGSKADEEHNITMNVNGINLSFSQEAVGGKRINLRTGETGAVELNIEGKRPKKYITSRSDYTSASGSGRREHSREDRRSDRASRRSSRSTYSGRGLLE